jgi:hypothetical protein
MTTVRAEARRRMLAHGFGAAEGDAGEEVPRERCANGPASNGPSPTRRRSGNRVAKRFSQRGLAPSRVPRRLCKPEVTGSIPVRSTRESPVSTGLSFSRRATTGGAGSGPGSIPPANEPGSAGSGASGPALTLDRVTETTLAALGWSEWPRHRGPHDLRRVHLPRVQRGQARRTGGGACRARRAPRGGARRARAWAGRRSRPRTHREPSSSCRGRQAWTGPSPGPSRPGARSAPYELALIYGGAGASSRSRYTCLPPSRARASPML